MKKISVRGSIVSSGEKWIYDWFGLDATSPKEVQEALAEAGGESVVVEINSGGGDIFAGSEIYTLLRGYAGSVEVQIVGLAASAASVIAQAGHSKISPTGLFMVHNVSGSAYGDYRDMAHQQEVLETANRSIAAAYVEKTGKTLEELQQIMDHETWMDAQKAVEYGFVDEVMFAEQPSLMNGIGVLSAQTIAKMKKTIGNPQTNADFFVAKTKLALLKKKGEMHNEI